MFEHVYQYPDFVCREKKTQTQMRIKNNFGK